MKGDLQPQPAFDTPRDALTHARGVLEQTPGHHPVLISHYLLRLVVGIAAEGLDAIERAGGRIDPWPVAGGPHHG